MVTARCVMLNDETRLPLRPRRRCGCRPRGSGLRPNRRFRRYSFKPMLQGYPLPRRETLGAQSTAWVRLRMPSLRLLNILPLCLTSQNDVCGRVGRVIRRMSERSP